MLMPKRVKHRKQHRGHRRGKASGGTVVSFGEFGLQALEACWMTANQIEAARIAMNRYVRRAGKIWIRVFPDKPFTKKPAETRMGSGKGAPEGWVAVIKPGRVLFEMGGVTEEQAKEAMRLASHKLPIETKFIKRADNAAVTKATANTEEVEIPVEAVAASEAPVAETPVAAVSETAAPAPEATPVAETPAVEPTASAEETATGTTEENDGGA